MCDVKTCTTCGDLKPLSDFYPRKDTKHGFDKVCKKCRLKQSTENYKKRKLLHPEALKLRWTKSNASEKQKERQKKWRKDNPEKQKEATEKWRKANPEKIKARERRRSAGRTVSEKMKIWKKEWGKNHPEKIKEYSQKWKTANPEKALRVQVRRRLRDKLSFNPPLELLETALVVSLVKKELKNEHPRPA